MKDSVQTHHFDALGNTRQPDLQPSLEEMTRESLARWTVPGAAIGILQDGETTYSSFGVTSLETQQPVTPETVFRVASISKPFTATLAMTLVNDGLLDLDRTIAEYLPGIALSDAEPDRQARITMRHLLSHTAGLDCEIDADLATVGAGDDASAQAIAMYGGLHQWGEPGEIMSYGNTGFWLAGHVIATLLHTAFEDAMRERVFRPLGLERSLFTAEEAIVYPVALGHQPKSLTDGTHELIRSYAYPRARTPSGGVISTVVDLLRFADWHIGGSEKSLGISDEVRLEMKEPYIRLRQADGESWGIGWDIRQASDGTRIIGHGGSFGGFQTQLTIVPSRKFAFVILTNSARGGMANAEIERAVLSDRLDLTLPEHGSHELSGKQLMALAGTYRQPLATYEIIPSGYGLDVVVHGIGLDGEALPVPPPIRFDAIGESDFIVRDGDQKGMRADFLLDPATGIPSYVRIGLRIAERVDDVA